VRSRKVVVVLPLVPVVASTRTSRPGWPCQAAAIQASAIRPSPTCTQVAPTPAGAGVSATITATPRASAVSMKACPSQDEPRVATNRPPGPTSRESCAK